MPHGEHNVRQTAFRLPEAVRVWLQDQAGREDRSMTAIVIEALETYRVTATGTQCCGALITTATHQAPSWHTCAKCGQPVTVTGQPVTAPA